MNPLIVEADHQQVKTLYEFQRSKIKNKDHQEMIRMAKKYKWEYTWELVSDILMELSPLIVLSNTERYYDILRDEYGNKIGFVVIFAFTDDIGKAEVKYLFIKPGYRKRGHATRVINCLKEQEIVNRIYADTKNPEMIALLNKLDFKEVGICSNNIETCYKWERV
jgi:RimJ/RimL family protein N-acetyltransferase